MGDSAEVESRLATSLRKDQVVCNRERERDRTPSTAKIHRTRRWFRIGFDRMRGISVGLNYLLAKIRHTKAGFKLPQLSLR